jgi:hypothetical protein
MLDISRPRSSMSQGLCQLSLKASYLGEENRGPGHLLVSGIQMGGMFISNHRFDN